MSQNEHLVQVNTQLEHQRQTCPAPGEPIEDPLMLVQKILCDASRQVYEAHELVQRHQCPADRSYQYRQAYEVEKQKVIDAVATNNKLAMMNGQLQHELARCKMDKSTSFNRVRKTKAELRQLIVHIDKIKTENLRLTTELAALEARDARSWEGFPDVAEPKGDEQLGATIESGAADRQEAVAERETTVALAEPEQETGALSETDAAVVLDSIKRPVADTDQFEPQGGQEEEGSKPKKARYMPSCTDVEATSTE